METETTGKVLLQATIDVAKSRPVLQQDFVVQATLCCGDSNAVSTTCGR